jgi:hypothetical protein
VVGDKEKGVLEPAMITSSTRPAWQVNRAFRVRNCHHPFTQGWNSLESSYLLS